MTLSTSPTQGYKLLEGWSFTISQTGQTGSKAYLVDSPDLPGQTREAVPTIGEAWDDDYPEVTCKSITKTFMTGCVSAAKWTCYFDTLPFNEASTPLSSDDLSRSVDVGGEFLAWEPKAGAGWSWDTGGAQVKQPIFKNLVQSTIRIPVIVGTFDDFWRTSLDTCGRINDAEFLNIPEGNVLYVGCNIVEYKNAWGARRWRADMNFVVRSLGDADIDASGNNWQYMMNEATGFWDKPKDSDGDFMYETADFSQLFNHALGNEEDLYPNPPTD
jgi:hypothetical protein